MWVRGRTDIHASQLHPYKHSPLTDTRAVSSLPLCPPLQRIDMDGIFAHPWFQRDLPEGALAMNTSYLQSAPNLDPVGT